MTSRNMLVMPSTTPPDQPRGTRRSLVASVVAVIVVIVAAVLWWPSGDDRAAPDGPGTDRIALGGELHVGESITAGDYSFAVTDENLQVRRRGADGVDTQCWSNGSGQRLEAVRVTLEGLVMTGRQNHLYGTIAPQSMGASDPNVFALRIDPADGTVRVGDVVLAECAPA